MGTRRREKILPKELHNTCVQVVHEDTNITAVWLNTGRTIMETRRVKKYLPKQPLKTGRNKKQQSQCVGIVEKGTTTAVGYPDTGRAVLKIPTTHTKLRQQMSRWCFACTCVQIVHEDTNIAVV